MNPAILVALIGAASAVLGAGLVFLSKLWFDHPVAEKQVDVSQGTLLLAEATYLQSLIAPLRTEVAQQAAALAKSREDCEGQIATVRADAARQIAAVQHDKDALEQLTARLSLRIDALEQHGDATHG